MPTSAAVTYGIKKLEAKYPSPKPVEMAVNIAASQTIARGTLLGEVTASPGTFSAYASGNSDGTQVPTAIAVYDMATDASGNITLGGTGSAGLGDFNLTQKTAPVYINGDFDCSELIGLDANALTLKRFALVHGTVSNGTVALR